MEALSEIVEARISSKDYLVSVGQTLGEGDREIICKVLYWKAVMIVNLFTI